MHTPLPSHLDPTAASARLTSAPARSARADATDRLRADVAARLGPVCAGMAPEHVERLVADVTAFTLRWAADTAVRDPGVAFRAD